VPAAAIVATTEIFWAFFGIQPLDHYLFLFFGVVHVNDGKVQTTNFMIFVKAQRNICLKL